MYYLASYSQILLFKKMTVLQFDDRAKLTGIVGVIVFVHLILVSNSLIHE